MFHKKDISEFLILKAFLYHWKLKKIKQILWNIKSNTYWSL